MEVFNGNVFIVGAGFSSSAGLPLTSEISKYFLQFPPTAYTPTAVQTAISRQLRRFWEDVFAYEDTGPCPSFEDHFTALDLAANTGHNIGRYSPTQLRALRRLSIHRVLDILDSKFVSSPAIRALVEELGQKCETAIISTNWDVVAEKHLDSSSIPFTYDIPGIWSPRIDPPTDAIPLIKLHGSANWHYCDGCRSTTFGSPHKTALLFRTFLEGKDFLALNEQDVVDEVKGLIGDVGCQACHNPKMSARLATFSYSKSFDFFAFHAMWDKALQLLREAPFWTFVGYSLPDADFAFRNLLLTAAAASLGQGHKHVRVITYDGNGTGAERERYSRLFGHRLEEFHDEGFDEWVTMTSPLASG